MLLIFVPIITKRIEYVFSHIFKEISGIDYSLTTEKTVFSHSSQPKFSYSKTPLDNELFFHAEGLLEQAEVNPFVPETGHFQNIITLFPNSNEASALPYDIFSAVFFMLSRYEEYLPFTPDKHDRFEAAQSLAFQFGFLQEPVVDLWIKQLAGILKSAFPDLKFREKKFIFTPTYDIDIAYAYRCKGFLRSSGGFLKDAFTGNFSNFFTRLKVILNITTDPSDTYDYQFGLQKKYELHPVYFFHPGTYGKFDKNCSPENKNIRKLLQSISNHADLGIHPSYLSSGKTEMLAAEIGRLEKASGRKITKARQHFIRISLPETYQNYIKNNITDDYSMGFATETGFRAGTSEPFYFFDLQKNEETKLLIHPFALMDGVYIQYHPATAEEIPEKIRPLIAQVKALNGTFISLFHNNTFCDTPEMRHWRDIYEEIIKFAMK